MLYMLLAVVAAAAAVVGVKIETFCRARQIRKWEFLTKISSASRHFRSFGEEARSHLNRPIVSKFPQNTERVGGPES